jgi:transposase
MQTTGEDVISRAVYDETVRVLEARVIDLEARLAWFERQIFGVKSERFVPAVPVPGQLLLDFGGDAELAAVVEATKLRVEAHDRTVTKPQKDHPGREPIPADLPRKTETIEPEGGTEGLIRIGEDVTETLEYKAGEMWVRRVVRPRYARPEVEQAALEAEAEAEGAPPPPQVVQAPAPDCPFPRLKAGVSMLVHILVSKFVDHLPLYRISGQLARQQLKLPDSTLGDWAKTAADHLIPLYAAYRKVLFKASYLQFDETTIKVLEGGKEGSSERSPDRRRTPCV